MDKIRYLTVPKLERWQHYKDRRPPWMKLHIEIFDNYEFGLLPDSAKYHLLGIWLLATQLDNKIPYDINWISRKIGASELVDVELLLAQGHLVYHDASNEIAGSKQNALAETETETETETEKNVIKKPPPVDNSDNKKKYTETDKEVADTILITIRKDVAPSAKGSSSWPDTIRLMRERDGLTHDEILDMFGWANNDGFWRANILSPQKLRDKWTQLEAQRRNGKNRNNSKPGSAASRDKTHRELYSEIAREGADEENMDIDYFRNAPPQI